MNAHLATADYRRLFQRAVRENTTVEEARRRDAEERWQQSQRRLADRRCGTSVAADEGSDPLGWWKNL